jgi:hypothetical protein
MDEETKLKMMENLLKNAHVGQLNMVMGNGATVNYYEAGTKENDSMPLTSRYGGPSAPSTGATRFCATSLLL